MDPITIALGVIVGAAALSAADDKSFSYTPPSGGSYRFRLRQVGSEWRAYILDQPSYGSRRSDGHVTHRYYDASESRHYVCYEPMPRSADDARAVAKRWAEGTTRYCRNGEPF